MEKWKNEQLNEYLWSWESVFTSVNSWRVKPYLVDLCNQDPSISFLPFLSTSVCWLMCVRVCLGTSVMSLCDPMDCSPPGYSVHGTLQARTLEWVSLPSSRRSPDPGMELVSPALVGRLFTSNTTWEVLSCLISTVNFGKIKSTSSWKNWKSLLLGSLSLLFWKSK